MKEKQGKELFMLFLGENELMLIGSEHNGLISIELSGLKSERLRTKEAVKGLSDILQAISHTTKALEFVTRTISYLNDGQLSEKNFINAFRMPLRLQNGKSLCVEVI